MRAAASLLVGIAALAMAEAALAGDPEIERLLQDRHLESAFREVVLRLVHDPRGEVAYEALASLEPALAGYSPGRFRRLMATSLSSFGRGSRAALDLLEATRRLAPTPDGYHDPLQGRRLLHHLLGDEGQPVLAALALWRLARETAATAPADGAVLLRRLLGSRALRLAPRLRAQGQLLLGVCLARAGKLEEAASAYTEGLGTSADLPAPRGGTLEPFFRHGLADVLRSLGRRREARRELERVLAAPRYPALEAARAELATLG